MTLPGKSTTIVVEPLRAPAEVPPPAEPPPPAEAPPAEAPPAEPVRT